MWTVSVGLGDLLVHIKSIKSTATQCFEWYNTSIERLLLFISILMAYKGCEVGGALETFFGTGMYLYY